MTDRVPPHDLEAEIAVLGAMLLVSEPAEAKAIADVVTVSDFYRAGHARFFQTTLDCWETRGACDVLLIRNELQEAGHLEAVGGTTFISRVMASVPSSANAVHYARIVRKRRLERDVIQALNAHEQAAYEHGNGTASNAAEAVAQAQAALDDFSHPRPLADSSWDFADLHAETDDPPPDEVVARLFVRPSFNIVFGPPQAGKSWAVMGLCLDAVMGGGSFLGCDELNILPLREIRDGRAERCLWIFGGEDSKARVKRRLKTLHGSGPHAGKDIPRGAFVIATPPGGTPVHMTDGWRWLARMVDETEATMVVLDTIQSLTVGLDVKKEEHSVPFITKINMLRAAKNLVVIALHHTRKGSSDAKKGSESKADAMIGSQAWRALAEGVLMLDAQDGDTSKVTVISVKAKDIDRPIPKFTVTLESPGGRFRVLDDDEIPNEREGVGRAGRAPRNYAEELARIILQEGQAALDDVPRLLGVSERTWANRRVETIDALNRANHVVLAGVVKRCS